MTSPKTHELELAGQGVGPAAEDGSHPLHVIFYFKKT